MKKIIQLKDNKFAISIDSWKTFEIISKETINATIESNRDKRYEVILRYTLGENKAKIVLNELKNIRQIINNDEIDGYGHAFEVFAISIIYNLNYKEVFEKYIVQGNEDGGIDAIVHSVSDDQVEIFQIKLGNINEDVTYKMKNTHINYINNGEINSNCSHLKDFYDKNISFIKGKAYTYYTICDNLDKPTNIKPFEIYKKFFENRMLIQENNLTLELQVPNNKDKDGNIFYALSETGTGAYVYFVKAKKIINELLSCDGIKDKKNLNKFFYDNVRGYIKENESMKKTIIEEPNNFVKYNNGVTVTGEVTYIDSSGLFKIKNPVISNGQQTIYNLVNNEEKVDEIWLCILIKNIDSDDQKGKIARHTNEQTAIKYIDLLSLDKNVRSIQKELFNDNYNDDGFFLDVNTSGDKGYKKLKESIFSKEKRISLSEFCKLYYSYNDNQIGTWKNAINKQIKSLLERNIDTFDKSLSIKVCNTIVKYNEYVKTKIQDKKIKNDLKSADLAFMYIMLKYGKNEEETELIIKNINDKYFYANIPSKPSKLIDLYKTNEIIDKINIVIKEIEQGKKAKTKELCSV